MITFSADRAAADRVLGADPATGAPVTVRCGPYGAYVQLGGAQFIAQAADPTEVEALHPDRNPAASSRAAAVPGDACGAVPGGGVSKGAVQGTAEETEGVPAEASSAAGSSKGRKKVRKKAAEPGVRRAALRPGMHAEHVTLADALALLQYPKVFSPCIAAVAEGVAEIKQLCLGSSSNSPCICGQVGCREGLWVGVDALLAGTEPGVYLEKAVPEKFWSHCFAGRDTEQLRGDYRADASVTEASAVPMQTLSVIYHDVKRGVEVLSTCLPVLPARRHVSWFCWVARSWAITQATAALLQSRSGAMGRLCATATFWRLCPRRGRPHPLVCLATTSCCVS